MPPGNSGSAFQLPSGRWQEVIDLDLALKTDFQRVGAYALDLGRLCICSGEQPMSHFFPRFL